MSTSIEEVILSLKFDNKQFEKGVATSLKSFESLKKAMDFKASEANLKNLQKTVDKTDVGKVASADKLSALQRLGRSFDFATEAVGKLSNLQSAVQRLTFRQPQNGLSELQTQANGFSLAPMGVATDQISAKFLAMSTIAITALSNIVNKAVDAGLNLTKSLTIGPVGEGFNDYNTKLTSVQTVMNATGKSLDEVGLRFNELDEYADKTIYNLSDMTSAFAKFTNQAIDMDTAVPAIKGIANMVALAGQDANAASSAMYNLTQSIGAGFLTTTDYKSLNLMNVATKEFRDQLTGAAVAAGTLAQNADGTYTILSDGSRKVVNSQQLFNDELSRGWANADILLGVLNDYGDTTTEIGKKAQAAAQDVKSLPMMIDTLKASVGTSWTDTFELIFGDLKESKELFTGMTTSIQGMLDAFADARNVPLGEWKELGGREKLIEGLKDAVKGLLSVLIPIKDAFKQVFPPATGKSLLTLTERFAAFAKGLTVSGETADRIKRIFAGFFSVFKIVGTVIGNVIGLFAGLTAGAATGEFGFLELLAVIGDLIVSFSEFLTEGGKISDFFRVLGGIISVPIQALGFLGTAIKNALSSEGVGNFFEGFIDAIKSGASALMSSFGEIDWNAGAAVISAGLLGGLIVGLKNFIKNSLNLDSLTGGALSKIGDSFSALTDSLSAMQANLQSDTLLKIAAAVGILAASMFVLSTIDTKSMLTALGGMTAAFTQLVIAMGILGRVGGLKALVTMPAIAAALVVFSGAILILAVAMKLLATMNWEEIAKGLVAVTGLMGALVGAAVLLSKYSGGILRAGLAMLPLALAIGILAVSMKIFASMSWEEIGKGMASVAGGLVIISLAMSKMPMRLPFIALGLLAVGVSLNLIALAMKSFADISWKEMGKGLVGIGAALVVIGLAMKTMPLTLPATAAGLVLVALALQGVALFMKSMGGMSWEEIGKGMTVLAGAMLILSLGLNAIGPAGTLGAAGLILAAVGISLLVPALAALGQLSWKSIGKALAVLAVGIGSIALAAFVLGPAVPVLLGIGAAMLLFGAGVALLGAGIGFLGAGILALAQAISILGTVSKDAFDSLLDRIPQISAAIGEAFLAFAETLATNGPILIATFSTLIGSMLQAMIENVPLIGELFSTLMVTGITVLRTYIPLLIQTGFEILMAFLQGVRDNIYEMTTVGVDIIVNFIRGIEDNIDRVVTAAFNLAITFINSLATEIENNVGQITSAAISLGLAIPRGIATGIKKSLGPALESIKSAGQGFIAGFTSSFKIPGGPSKVFMDIGEHGVGGGFIKGIDRATASVERSSTLLSNAAVDKVRAAMEQLIDDIPDEPNLRPVITPVLDLSNMKMRSNQISSMLGVQDLDLSADIENANVISENEISKSEAEADSESESAGGDTIIYNQTNNSPKALPQVEIYRQTKSLLAQVPKK